ncbi:hypothetical protein [Tritonibacter mobilis]|uniref:Uncharacterized protein n=1 Tax=Tritonibacter mobilis F1926 TaxID=1265309 RepID=A0A1B1A1V4_9RHOB|nr:hypothetical protein [Tritonibacter mobilis]ANP40531.1 hypothetical protein K529_007115 [Tritonibacter mobilis F1926]KJZ25118.1 hypothetical protein TW79_05495 [Tritonibacter mobilis]
MIWEQALGIAGVLFLMVCCFIPRDPTQCNFIGALIGGAFGLLGASKQRKENQRINEANRPVNQVAEWEAAGINPLFGIGSGGYVPHQAASIGDAYATAGARFGQAIDQYRGEKLAETELKKENTALKEKLDELATPRIPSYLSQYGAIIPVPTIGATHGQVNRQDPRSVSGNVDGSGDLSPKSALRAARLGGAGDPTDYNPVKAPAYKAFGVPWVGSGAFGSGDSAEEALGDTPFTWLATPAIFGDMFGHTIGQAYSRHKQRKADKAMEEWFRREREGDPIKRDPFEQHARKLQSQNPYFRP